MKIYLSTLIAGDQSISLTEAGANKRLVSFYFIQNLKKEDIKTYLESGILPWNIQEEKENEANDQS